MQYVVRKKIIAEFPTDRQYLVPRNRKLTTTAKKRYISVQDVNTSLNFGASSKLSCGVAGGSRSFKSKLEQSSAIGDGRSCR